MLTDRFIAPFRPSLAFIVLNLLLAVLWLAGGASFSSVPAQVVVRAAAFLALLIMIVFGYRPTMASSGPIWMFLVASAALAVLQVTPLPPELWQSLPDRGMFNSVEEDNVWRSWSLVPGATINALSSLVVPLAILLLVSSISEYEEVILAKTVLILTVLSMMVGLFQFSSVAIDNPLINDSPDVISGTFANRNHFALFLSFGCLLVPIWMFQKRRLRWRVSVGIIILLLFLLTILASGSRAGIVIGALALIITGVFAKHALRKELRHAPRWIFPVAIAGFVVLVSSFVLVSLATDRAVSIQRALSVDVEQDMRSRAFPTVWAMTRASFPVGSGLGSFDPMFRVHEPLDLLKITYFNQAHNDFIDAVRGGGLPALLLLLTALVWWAWASLDAWRNKSDEQSILPQLGSAMLLLVFIASVFDYPARTPLMMAMMVLAAKWLAGRSKGERVSALPG